MPEEIRHNMGFDRALRVPFAKMQDQQVSQLQPDPARVDSGLVGDGGAYRGWDGGCQICGESGERLGEWEGRG